MKPWLKALMVGVLVLAAGFAAVQASRRLAVGREAEPKVIELETTPEVARVLASATANLESTGPEGAEALRSRLGTIVAERAAALGATAPNAGDLGRALGEQVTSILAGDGARHAEWLRDRGVRLAASPEAAMHWEKWAERLRWTKLGPGGIDVVAVCVNGEDRGTSDGLLERGFQVVTSAPADGFVDLPSDAKQGRLTIVEVRVPMDMGGGEGGVGAALAGFRYAWDRANQRWVPWSASVIADRRHTTVYAIPF